MKPAQPHYRSQSADTLNCNKIVPLSFDDGNVNFWSIQDEIDMSCYPFDLSESFSNIVKPTIDESTKDCLKSIQLLKSCHENTSPTNGDDNEVDEIIKALSQDENKLNNALNSINGSLSDGMAAKMTIEKSIAELYESMKYATNLLPDPTGIPLVVGSLPVDSSKNFELASISNLQPLEDPNDLNRENEITSNLNAQECEKTEHENQDSTIVSGGTEIASSIKSQAREKAEYENQGKCSLLSQYCSRFYF